MHRNRFPKSGSRPKRRARQMFFESLEARQLLVADIDIGTIWETYEGNYVPPQEYKAGSAGFLTAPAAGSAQSIAINYLKQNAASFGAAAGDFNHYTVSKQYTDAHNGITHIYLQQTFNGLPVADAVAAVNISQQGQILTAGSNFVTGLPHPAQNTAPTTGINAQDAMLIVSGATLRYLGDPIVATPQGGQSQKTVFSGAGIQPLSTDPIPVELHYVAKPGGGVELAWKVTAQNPGMTHWFEASVSAQPGPRYQQVIRLVDWVHQASYNVFPVPVGDPLDGARMNVFNPQDPVASPFGWHDTNGIAGAEFFDTRGNNVNAQEDTNGDNAGGARPASPTLDFNFPLVLPGAPNTYQDAAITNLFYWNNINHDVTYHYGFDEVSGNFQAMNYTGQGLGGDPVEADAADGSGTNNANFGTPPDGISPRMQMFLFDITNPGRDGDLDGFIVTHEYGHGVSNRLTGGPANAGALNSLQSGGMGEGWSDWLGLIFTQKPTDTRDTPQTFGTWLYGQAADGPGIRRFPYSYDMNINGQTLGDFNGGFPANEVHNAGELWCSALWDMTWNLIDRHGFDPDLYNGTGGNNIALQLVLDGMKLQPANPSFLEARDAILAADAALTGSDNFEEIWNAFARRGFGLSADDGPDADSEVVVEAFDRPPPMTRVQGTVFNDKNGNGQVNGGDNPLEGWTIYVDANNNSRLDQGERSSISGANGKYSLTLNTIGTFTIREIVQQDWRVTKPTSGSYTISTSAGRTQTGKHFLNQEIPGEIHGLKYNDLNGNGERDAGEPGIEGVVVYVDINKNGSIGVMEQGAVTNNLGRFTIKNVLVGTDYHVREVFQPGMVQMFPDPLDTATLGGAHTGVVVTRNAITRNIDFGNMVALDFGDAPASYGTLLANNGPRHGILPGFGLTLTPSSGVGVVDAEANGMPTAGANGDDAVPGAGPDDENGVLIFGSVTPGQTSTVQVGVRTGGFSTGVLQGWIDFNRDGDFLDANERIITDRFLGTGVHLIQFQVPIEASLGATYARFRYGYERGIGPRGPALAGEVEDYSINVLENVPIAVNDVFPDAAFGDPLIQRNSGFDDNALNVLRNDFGTIANPQPEIVAADFPGGQQTTAAGGTVLFVSATGALLYAPLPGYTGVDSFTYRVTDGTTISPPATVTINVSQSAPVAVDDIVRLAPDVANQDIFVLANDFGPPGATLTIKPGSVVPLPGSTIPPGTSLTISGSKLVFTPASGFRGTVQYQYTIGVPGFTDSTATVTIQVTDGDQTPGPTHAAIFSVQYLDKDGVPLGANPMIDFADGFFFAQVIANDPVGTVAGVPETTGVEAAYIDLLVQNLRKDNPNLPDIVRPVTIGNNPPRFDINFSSQYELARLNSAEFSDTGFLNEIGGTHDPFGGAIGNGPKVVMTVRFQIVGTGEVRIQPDHADSAGTGVILFDSTNIFNDPFVLTDDQVFMQVPNTLRIV
ncbi:MAG: M36 family metallopeptidase, partial [Pirellulaceae bacterium]